MRRNGIAEMLMEVFHLSKFFFRTERLDFSNDWVANEGELGGTIKAIDIQPSAIQAL
jgi:hypothetical protein